MCQAELLFPGSFTRTWPESREAAFMSETFREIHRQHKAQDDRVKKKLVEGKGATEGRAFNA